jgi:hypothetical protein
LDLAKALSFSFLRVDAFNTVSPTDEQDQSQIPLSIEVLADALRDRDVTLTSLIEMSATRENEKEEEGVTAVDVTLKPGN